MFKKMIQRVLSGESATQVLEKESWSATAQRGFKPYMKRTVKASVKGAAIGTAVVGYGAYKAGKHAINYAAKKYDEEGLGDRKRGR